jgi:hypothetical protein
LGGLATAFTLGRLRVWKERFVNQGRVARVRIVRVCCIIIRHLLLACFHLVLVLVLGAVVIAPRFLCLLLLPLGVLFVLLCTLAGRRLLPKLLSKALGLSCS